MNKDSATLRRIEELPEPRHLFIIPSWAKSEALDRLIQGGYVTFSHLQRSKGVISMVMGLQLTAKGIRLAKSRFDWPRLAVRGSLAGASATAMSVLILYLG